MSTPNRTLSFRAAVLLALVASCRTTEEIQPSSASVLVRAEPLGITLAPSLRRWNEVSTSPGKRTRFRLGELLTRLFPAHDGRAYLSPVDARLENDWSGAASAWEARYALTLSLQLDGIHHEVRAVGHGRNGGDPRAAERAALEACMSDTYTRVAALLTHGEQP